MSSHPDELYQLARIRQQELHDLAARERPLNRDVNAASLTRLSRRERDVLRLLVERYSDREIAEALFVSYRTITTHVAHIFNKLGVNSRREAATVARMHALDGVDRSVVRNP
jgi:DNA-binding NarL/FixJ family response regulator